MHYYTVERNAQILIYLMKENGIKKIVVSPGTTNVCFVQSVQCDPFFEIYSAPDERSAAYIACGLAEESGAPVALSCTGATASRNYIPGLTEAFYRKIPILAITSAQPGSRIGHNIPQMIDRTNLLNDIAKLSVELPNIKDGEDEWHCNINANKALIKLKEESGGPVHINLVTSFSNDFSVKKLPPARVIRKYKKINDSINLEKEKIAIFCGAHSKWSESLTNLVEKFCERYNAVVLQDHTGNYHGKYGIESSLVLAQEKGSRLNDFDLIIHIGNISGAYFPLSPRQVWRINADGEICDTFRTLTKVFEMSEAEFFSGILELDRKETEVHENKIFDLWEKEDFRLRNKIGEIPFSNAWIAMQTASILPDNSVLHLAILNSLRNWNFFKLPRGIDVYANTGGFGIDGCVSALIGASLANPDKLYYGVVGDLAFFYDMNSLGNRHVGNNLRLIVVNNGCGTEFMNYNNQMANKLGDNRNSNIAAEGHYGCKSESLLKEYVTSLGFSYMSAHNKEEYLSFLNTFVNPQISGGQSMIVEVFTNSTDESDALRMINTLDGEKEDREQLTRSSIPKRFKQMSDSREMVLWGTGACFKKNISEVMSICNVKYVCDNNDALWGREIFQGVSCISPEQLLDLDSPFVVIMIENGRIGFQVASQLLDMGITDFDLYDNWITYADSFKG